MTDETTAAAPAPAAVATEEAQDTILGSSAPDPGAGETTETATTEEQTDAQASDAKAGEVPEKYEFTLPEGVTLDEELVKSFDPVARELKLTNPQAQKLAELLATHNLRQAELHNQNWLAQVKTWADESKADKEIGGENFKANVQAAITARDRFGTPQLQQILDSSGFGNHPEVVRFFARVGQAMSEDKFHQGGSTTTPRSAEQKLYPTMYTNNQD